MEKVYVVEVDFSDGDSFVGGIYTSLENGIKAIEKWANCPEVTEVKTEVKEKDFAILKVFFEEDNKIVVFRVTDYYFNVDIPECF